MGGEGGRRGGVGDGVVLVVGGGLGGRGRDAVDLV